MASKASSFVRAMRWSVPAIFALVALAGVIPWILGTPSNPNAAYATGWELGLYALFGYISAYGLALILWLIALMIRRPKLVAFVHGFAWLALAAFLITQCWAWVLILTS